MLWGSWFYVLQEFFDSSEVWAQARIFIPAIRHYRVDTVRAAVRSVHSVTSVHVLCHLLHSLKERDWVGRKVRKWPRLRGHQNSYYKYIHVQWGLWIKDTFGAGAGGICPIFGGCPTVGRNSQCPLYYRCCPLAEGSITRGSTVHAMYTTVEHCVSICNSLQYLSHEGEVGEE